MFCYLQQSKYLHEQLFTYQSGRNFVSSASNLIPLLNNCLQQEEATLVSITF